MKNLMNLNDPRYSKHQTAKLGLLFVGGVLLVSAVISIAFAHPQSECSKELICDYQMIEDRFGRERSAYVCE